MFNFFKKNRVVRKELVITWCYTDEPEVIYTERGCSAGLASLDTDPCVVILSVKEA